MPNPRLFRLKVHDCFQVEVKFDYPLDPATTRERFLVDLFLFVPSSLDLNPGTYGKEDFYQDVQTYTRYATPTPTAAQLLDAENELSPLTRLARLRQRWGAAPPQPGEVERAIYELRLLACMCRVHIRDQADAVAAGLQTAGVTAASLEAAAAGAARLLDEAAQLTARLRAFGGPAAGSPLPPAVAQAWTYVDEAVSLKLEGACGQLHRSLCAVNGQAAGLDTTRVRQVARRAAGTIRAEEEYRARAGWATRLDAAPGPAAETAHEDYVHRMAALKKYVQSVLFLSVRAHQGSRPFWYALYALSAMVAMAVFVIALWLFQDVAPMNSVPYILLAAVAYALKDRLKDGLKQVFSAHMTGMLNDREGQLLDRTTGWTVVGRTAEAFSFVPLSEVPVALRPSRDRDELDRLAEEGAPDQVLRYQKSVTLYTGRIFHMHRRAIGINEILRYNFRRFLWHMDEPRKTLALPPEGPVCAGPPPAGAVDQSLPPLATVAARKVYGVGLAIGVHTPDEKGSPRSQWERYRLILTRDGILRVEAEEAPGRPR